MDGRGTDAERARLQRAAYGRHATDADREALAAFERREAAVVPVGRTPPGADRVPEPAEADAGGRRDHDGLDPAPGEAAHGGDAPAADGRRFGGRAVIAAALGGLLVGAGAVVAIDAAAPRDALDVFIAAPPEAPRDSVNDAFSLFVQDLDPSAALPLAGPVLLTSTERWDVYGFLLSDAAADGGQRVCLGLVPPRPSRSAASGSSCAEVADFRRDGLRIGADAPGTGDIGAEAVWHPDGRIELTAG